MGHGVKGVSAKPADGRHAEAHAGLDSDFLENGQDQETSLAVGMVPATPSWPLIMRQEGEVTVIRAKEGQNHLKA